MLTRLKLMQRVIINAEVVKIKITLRDITKFVFDQIRISCIKKGNTGHLVKLF